MMAFLLRFQEQCDAAPAGLVCTGTETHTYVRAEQVDSDPRHHDFRSLPIDSLHSQSEVTNCNASVAVLAGTKTVTEVRQEAADNDPTSRMFDTVPKVTSQ
jgi:hypothetical protein